MPNNSHADDAGQPANNGSVCIASIDGVDDVSKLQMLTNASQ